VCLYERMCAGTCLCLCIMCVKMCVLRKKRMCAGTCLCTCIMCVKMCVLRKKRMCAGTCICVHEYSDIRSACAHIRLLSAAISMAAYANCTSCECICVCVVLRETIPLSFYRGDNFWCFFLIENVCMYMKVFNLVSS